MMMIFLQHFQERKFARGSSRCRSSVFRSVLTASEDEDDNPDRRAIRIRAAECLHNLVARGIDEAAVGIMKNMQEYSQLLGMSEMLSNAASIIEVEQQVDLTSVALGFFLTCWQRQSSRQVVEYPQERVNELLLMMHEESKRT